jgi:hypothetical protein
MIHCDTRSRSWLQVVVCQARGAVTRDTGWCNSNIPDKGHEGTTVPKAGSSIFSMLDLSANSHTKKLFGSRKERVL